MLWTTSIGKNVDILGERKAMTSKHRLVEQTNFFFTIHLRKVVLSFPKSMVRILSINRPNVCCSIIIVRSKPLFKSGISLYFVKKNTPTNDDYFLLLGSGDSWLQYKTELGKQTVQVRTQKQTGKEICRFCGKKFVHASNAKRHERIHTGFKPYVCKFCNRSFNQSHSLTQHERLHTGHKPYPCEFCGVRFIRLSEKRSHEKKCSFHSVSWHDRKRVNKILGKKIFILFKVSRKVYKLQLCDFCIGWFARFIIGNKGSGRFKV